MNGGHVIGVKAHEFGEIAEPVGEVVFEAGFVDMLHGEGLR
jgi:hypothetical protein